MRVLGIESSCDETAAAVVDETGKVLGEALSSQIRLHAPYGGVVPELASRAHLRAVIPVIREALQQAGITLAAIDAIAVTQGPGLVGALLVGVQVARAAAWSLGKPLVGVDHLSGHLLAVHLQRPGASPPAYPYIALLASGGHTALYEVRSPLDIELLGQTRDDAAGEAFDKVAKLLGLGYPGGPVVDRLAALGDPKAVTLPPPMPGGGLDFSFSGLKTAVASHVRAHGPPKSDKDRADLCASFQSVLVEVLVAKSLTACRARGIRALALTGGVAANNGLRTRAAAMCAQAGVTLHVPPLSSCTDNAAMIAYAGIQQLLSGQSERALRVYSRAGTRLELLKFPRAKGV